MSTTLREIMLSALGMAFAALTSAILAAPAFAQTAI